MIHILTSSNIALAKSALGLFEKDIRKAVLSAEKKTLTWARREAARGLATAAGIPYKAARIRVKKQGKRFIWVGLNPISAKYLTNIARKGTFTNLKLNAHPFQRVGKSRLPIRRVEESIEVEGMAYLAADFTDAAKEKMVEEFINALAKDSGQNVEVVRGIFRP